MKTPLLQENTVKYAGFTLESKILPSALRNWKENLAAFRITGGKKNTAERKG